METNENQRDVVVQAGARRLHGHLTVPSGATGVVAFAHGSGSGRNSPRNQQVARQLNQVYLVTLLMDLLDEVEAQDRINVFDVELLADRLLAAACWLCGHTRTRGLPLGYFGAKQRPLSLAGIHSMDAVASAASLRSSMVAT
jgi:putative phosphoribosyl transferase